MERYVIDSWAWIEYFAGSTLGKVVDKIVTSENTLLITSVINQYEVFVKLLKLRDKQYAQNAINLIEELAKVEPLSREILESAAELKVNYGVAMADSIVASTALKYNAIVLTGDPDFEAVPALKFKLLK